ncbi:MarR family transcriptional regulator [Microbulbifer sp. OS29]|uniref:MarR family transcriptional regulator n=1 Tax=Microbulbifer okhotskensis TaxID=2926617 RepID=A0A9X2ESE5_9GAMM|nr:MarR family transcriptional regulator [Microbulbifer okhotskensis]MCO1336954.1 MarR family transcriptional regulator [Microbulbifer okhotskensis]
MSEFSHDLLALRETNIGRLFQYAAKTYSERAVALLHNYGFSDITLSHTQLISNLSTTGDSITSLAEKAGMTKQAMGQLANELQSKGYVKKVPNEQDKRSSMVQFTQRGEEALTAAYKIKLQIDVEYAKLLGVDNLKNLRKLLEKLQQETQS